MRWYYCFPLFVSGLRTGRVGSWIPGMIGRWSFWTVCLYVHAWMPCVLEWSTEAFFFFWGPLDDSWLSGRKPSFSWVGGIGVNGDHLCLCCRLWGHGVNVGGGRGYVQCVRQRGGRRWGMTSGRLVRSSHKWWRRRRRRARRWWSLQILGTRGNTRGGLSSWHDKSSIPLLFSCFLLVPIIGKRALFLLLTGLGFVLPCRALIGCRGVLVGGSGGWCLALELRVTKGTCLLDIKPFLQTASVEEMTARSDHSAVHVLEEMRAQTHAHAVVWWHFNCFQAVCTCSHVSNSHQPPLNSEPDVNSWSLTLFR